MKRKIKFRAFSTKQSISGTTGMWEIPSMEELLDNRSYDYGYPSDYILMQYTGLKDKNGKEIYEGDVLMRGEKGEGDITGEVVYHHSGFFMEFEKGKRMSVYEDFEVIGNIYENPELVEKAF